MNISFLFVFLPVFGVLTCWRIRRSSFEIFYYAHHAFLVLILIVSLHATSSWYFISAGVSLWLIDRLIRYQDGLKQQVETLDYTSILPLSRQRRGLTRAACAPPPPHLITLTL